jgi:uncharacterized membrane protein
VIVIAVAGLAGSETTIEACALLVGVAVEVAEIVTDAAEEGAVYVTVVPVVLESTPPPETVQFAASEAVKVTVSPGISVIKPGVIEKAGSATSGKSRPPGRIPSSP